MRIIAAEPHHVDALTELVLSSKAYEGEYASILDGFRVDLRDEHVAFLAEHDGEILGFYKLIVESAELDLMFVADAAQGLGVGQRLIEHMLREAAQRGIEAVHVVSHPPSAGFYQRMGAKQIGVIPANPPKIRWERPELEFRLPPCELRTPPDAP